jgi:hypothetical protein
MILHRFLCVSKMPSARVVCVDSSCRDKLQGRRQNVQSFGQGLAAIGILRAAEDVNHLQQRAASGNDNTQQL